MTMSESSSLTPGKSLESDLRLIREAKGLTREDVFNRVHIRPEVLAQVEEFGFAATPTLSSDIHRRSFVKHYADAIEIDSAKALQALNQSLDGSYSGLLAREYLGGADPGEPKSAATEGEEPVAARDSPKVVDATHEDLRPEVGASAIVGRPVEKIPDRKAQVQKEPPQKPTAEEPPAIESQVDQEPEKPETESAHPQPEAPPEEDADVTLAAADDDEITHVKVVSSEGLEDAIPELPKEETPEEIPWPITKERTEAASGERPEPDVEGVGAQDAEKPELVDDEDTPPDNLKAEDADVETVPAAPEPEAPVDTAEPSTPEEKKSEEEVVSKAKVTDEEAATEIESDSPPEEETYDEPLPEEQVTALDAVTDQPVAEPESEPTEKDEAHLEPVSDEKMVEPDAAAEETRAQAQTESADEAVQDEGDVTESETVEPIVEATDKAPPEPEPEPESEEAPMEESATVDEAPAIEETEKTSKPESVATPEPKPGKRTKKAKGTKPPPQEPQDTGETTQPPDIPESPYAPPLPGSVGESRSAAASEPVTPPKKRAPDAKERTPRRRRSRPTTPVPPHVPDPVLGTEPVARPAEQRESWSHVRSSHWITWLGLLGVLVVVGIFVIRSFTNWLSVDQTEPANRRTSVSLETLPERFSGFVRRDDITEEFVTLVIGPADSVDPNSFEFRMWTHSAGSLYAMTGEATLTDDGEQITLPDPYGAGGVFVSEEGEVRMRSVRRIEFPRWEFTGQMQ